MAWFWHGAYIRDMSVDELKKFVQEEIPRALDGNISFENSPSVQYRIADYVACISERVGDWIGIWGLTSRLLAHLFEKGNLSGMLMGGSDEETGGEQYSSNWWFYMQWRQGIIEDWHVYKPVNLFSEWSDDNCQQFVFPYLQEQGVHFDTSSHSQLIGFVKQHPDFFHGNPQRLYRWLNFQPVYSSIENWLDMRPSEAFLNASKTLTIPFIGTAYDPIAIATYNDVVRGIIPLSPFDYPFNDSTIYDLYEWVIKSIPGVDQMKLLSFQWVDEKYRSALSLDYSNLIYW